MHNKGVSCNISTKSAGLEKENIIKESDPFFGVIDDKLVDISLYTIRLRLGKEVIEGMRQYLLADDGAEIMARGERIKSSLSSLKNYPLGEKSMLRLKPSLVISSDINKSKGLVFDYGKKVVADSVLEILGNGQKVMGVAIHVGIFMSMMASPTGL